MRRIGKHKVRCFVIIFIFIAFLGRYQYKMPKRQFADFHVYHYTAQVLAERGNIYDDQAYRRDGIANFKYPPIVGLIFYPLGFLNENSAAIIWYTLNFILILLFFYWSSRIVFVRPFNNRRKNWVYFLSFLFTLRIFAQNFDEGQVNILMMSMLAFALYLFQRRKRFTGSLALAFSVLVKYMSIIFIPYFLFKKKFKVVFYFCLSLFVLVILPAFFLSFDYNLSLQKSFIPFLCKTSLDFGSMSTHANQSLVALILRYFSNFTESSINILNLSKFHLGFLVGSAFVFLYLLTLCPSSKYKKGDNFTRVIDYGLLFVCAGLFNPNGWIHSFVFLTFSYMVCFYYLFKVQHKDKLVWAMVGISGILISWPDELFIQGVKDAVDVYSLLSLAALLLFAALLKIKFYPVSSFLEDSRG